MVEVIPSIIAKDYKELEEKIRAVEPYVERVQIDIMDGIFVQNRTMDGMAELQKLETDLAIEIHLMVNKPENHIPRFLETKADKFLVHWETTQKFQECINLVKDSDKIFGAVLNPETGHEPLGEFTEQLDLIQFMTVSPGAYGAKFIDDVLDKMSDFHFFYPDIPIQVDGGVNLITAPKLIQAGAKILVAGSYIFDSDNIGEAINNLREIINSK